MKVLNNKRKVISIIIVLILIISAGYYFFIYQKKDTDNILLDNNIVEVKDESDINDSDDIIVDIKGYVSKPGVYSFKKTDNARINSLIDKAGGLLKDADTSTINLSKRLEDEMIIIVYSKNEIANFTKTQEELTRKLEICENKLKNDACIKEEKTKNNKININEASITELETLNGIGKSKAEAIIEYRKKTKFKSIDEIKNVDGIGENLFASIKENITV